MNGLSKKSWKWMLIGWALLGLISNSGIGNLWAAQTDSIERDLSQKKKELKKIKKELHQRKLKEKEIRRKESLVLKRIHQVTAELQKKEKELKKEKAKGSRIKIRLEQTTNKIDVLNKEIEQKREKLIYRLNALYKMEKTPSEIFLSPYESYLNLLKTDKYLRTIIDSNVRLIGIYQHQVDLKKRFQEDLIEDESQWLRSVLEAEKKRREIKKVREANYVLHKSFKDKRKVYQTVIGKLEERAKGLQNLIDKLVQTKNRLAYRRPGNNIDRNKLPPPVQGRVVSLFKEKGQNGVVIKAPMGSEIQAVLPGKVLYSDWFKGFGNIVIIDHGDYIFTVSAFCLKLLKKVGDIVFQGESIALVGREDPSKSPSLYFEIRYRGKPQDPMEWISNLRK